MRCFFHHQTLAYVALLLWLLSSWSGLHEHHGHEEDSSTVVVHMEMMNDHGIHHAHDQHAGANADYVQTLLASFAKLDFPLLAILAVLLVFHISPPKPVFLPLTFKPPRRNAGLRPPLRAPPAFPV